MGLISEIKEKNGMEFLRGKEKKRNCLSNGKCMTQMHNLVLICGVGYWFTDQQTNRKLGFVADAKKIKNQVRN